MACGRYLPTLKAHKGWTAVSSHDLEEPSGECEACGKQEVRYLHTLTHSDHPSIDVGVVCAGKLTEDYVNSVAREKAMKAKSGRKKRELQRYCGYYNNLPWTPLPCGSEGGCALVGDTWIKVKKLNFTWAIDWTRKPIRATNTPITRSAFIQAKSFIEAAHEAVFRYT